MSIRLGLICFICCLLFNMACGQAQEVDYVTREIVTDKYYPQNKFIRASRIRFIIDSSEYILPGKRWVHAYDVQGRLIGEYLNTTAPSAPPFLYRENGDTLVRLRFKEGTQEPYAYERFVYNSGGKILSYLECRNYYYIKDSFTVRYEQFYYDDKNIPEAKHTYYRERYKGTITALMDINSATLPLSDVVYYYYTKNRAGNRITIGKHTYGDPDWCATDSTVYDKQGRITRFNSFSKVGSLGCPVGNNVNRVIEYTYTDTSLITASYTTYCIVLTNDGCMEHSQIDKDITETVYGPGREKKVKYGINKGKVKIDHKYSYVYYDNASER